LREYETVIVLDPALDESRVNQEIDTVTNVITQGGGEVLEVQRWGRRRLAYEIRKKREGVYSLVRYKSERTVLDELNRRFLINESLLRHLTVLSEGPMAPPSGEEHGHHGDRRGEGPRRRDHDRDHDHDSGGVMAGGGRRGEDTTAE
jgi:small subunit ribosomal protein S6